MDSLGTKQEVINEVARRNRYINESLHFSKEVKKTYNILGRNLGVSFYYQEYRDKGTNSYEEYYINMKAKKGIENGLLENGFENSFKKK